VGRIRVGQRHQQAIGDVAGFGPREVAADHGRARDRRADDWCDDHAPIDQDRQRPTDVPGRGRAQAIARGRAEIHLHTKLTRPGLNDSRADDIAVRKHDVVVRVDDPRRVTNRSRGQARGGVPSASRTSNRTAASSVGALDQTSAPYDGPSDHRRLRVARQGSPPRGAPTAGA
jgi:hypothetical protein